MQLLSIRLNDLATDLDFTTSERATGRPSEFTFYPSSAPSARVCLCQLASAELLSACSVYDSIIDKLAARDTL